MRSVYYWVMLMVLFGCQPEPTQNQKNTEQNTRSHMPPGERIELKYAQNFTVKYHDHYKVVHLKFHSDGRSYHVDQKYVLVQAGLPVPALEGTLKGAIPLSIPINTLAINSKAEMIRLKELGLLDLVRAVGGTDLYDAELREWLKKHKVQTMGYDADHPQQLELLVAQSPELYVYFTNEPRGLQEINKMKKLDISALPHLGWSEPSFLAKAEWIKFTALFFNAEKQANEIFKQIEERCTTLMEKVAKEKPVQVFGTFHPAGAYDWWVHRNDYYASLFRAAGAVNVLADQGPTHYVPMNNEQLFDLAKEADIWIGNSNSDVDWPPASYLNGFKAYRNAQVYHYNKRTIPELNAYDWQETAVARPDLVLEDLVAIFYPHLLPKHELLFFDKVSLTKHKQ